jgi:hypothetical protein
MAAYHTSLLGTGVAREWNAAILHEIISESADVK